MREAKRTPFRALKVQVHEVRDAAAAINRLAFVALERVLEQVEAEHAGVTFGELGVQLLGDLFDFCVQVEFLDEARAHEHGVGLCFFHRLLILILSYSPALVLCCFSV